MNDPTGALASLDEQANMFLASQSHQQLPSSELHLWVDIYI